VDRDVVLAAVLDVVAHVTVFDDPTAFSDASWLGRREQPLGVAVERTDPPVVAITTDDGLNCSRAKLMPCVR